MRRKGRKAAVKKGLAASYEPSPREREALEAHRARQEDAPAAPCMKVEYEEGVPCVAVDHPDGKIGQRLLMEALGTSSFDFLDGIVRQLVNAGSQGSEADEKALNFMLSVVKGVGPKDEIETMLAAQMAAVHMSTMTLARRFGQVETVDQQDSAERALNKFARTFTTQIEALKRYRTGGEQNVTVKHVTVNEGGQAVVGNVTHGGRGVSEKRETTP